MSARMSTPPVSLIDVSTYLPGEPISADYYAQFAESDELRDNVMFRAPKFRHHVAKDESAIDMIERAVAGLRDVVPEPQAGQSALVVGLKQDVADRAGMEGRVHASTTSRTPRM